MGAGTGPEAADVVLVDSQSPGSGEVFDWSLAEGAPDGVRLLLAGGLNPDNVEQAIRKVRPWGVDASSGLEASPGKKDATKVRLFVARAKEAGEGPGEGGEPSDARAPHRGGGGTWRRRPLLGAHRWCSARPAPNRRTGAASGTSAAASSPRRSSPPSWNWRTLSGRPGRRTTSGASSPPCSPATPAGRRR